MRVKHHIKRTSRWLGGTKGSVAPRLWNMGAAYMASRRKAQTVSSYPFQMILEPALVCNYRCPACRHERRDEVTKNGRYMDVGAYQRLLDQIAGKTWHLMLTGNGESTLHPQFYDMLTYAVDRGFYVNFEHNGWNLDIDKLEASGAQSIHFALDGMSQETFSRYRVNGRFDRVKANLERLVDLRNRTGFPYIQLRFLVFRHNEHEIEAAREYLSSLDIDWYMQAPRLPIGQENPQTIMQKWALEVPEETFHEWSSTLPEFQIYHKDEDTGYYREVTSYGLLAPKCVAPWTMLFIRADGSAIPCCEMHNETELSLGNVFETSFDEVWNGAPIRELRHALAHDPASYYPCNVCPANLTCPSAGPVVGKGEPLPAAADDLLQLEVLDSSGVREETASSRS